MGYKMKCTECYYETSCCENECCRVCWNKVFYRETYEDYDKLQFNATKINIWWDYEYF